MKAPNLSPQAKTALGLMAVGIGFNILQYLLQEGRIYVEQQLTAKTPEKIIHTQSPSLHEHILIFLRTLNKTEIAARIFDSVSSGFRGASKK